MCLKVNGRRAAGYRSFHIVVIGRFTASTKRLSSARSSKKISNNWRSRTDAHSPHLSSPRSARALLSALLHNNIIMYCMFMSYDKFCIQNTRNVKCRETKNEKNNGRKKRRKKTRMRQIFHPDDINNTTYCTLREHKYHTVLYFVCKYLLRMHFRIFCFLLLSHRLDLDDDSIMRFADSACLIAYVPTGSTFLHINKKLTGATEFPPR